jgi:hypothetical protein
MILFEVVLAILTAGVGAAVSAAAKTSVLVTKLPKLVKVIDALTPEVSKYKVPEVDKDRLAKKADVDVRTNKVDEIKAEQPNYVKKSDADVEADAKKRGENELNKNDKDFEDKLEAFVQAVVITEAADMVDEPVKALELTLDKLIGSRFKVDFKYLRTGDGVFDILMNPKVKKGYTGNEYNRNKPSDLTGNDWIFDPKKDVDWRGTDKTHHDALDEAFKRTGLEKSEFEVTQWAKDKNGKSIPVEWEGPNTAKVNMDIPDWNNLKKEGLGKGPHQPHIGYQGPGKRDGSGSKRGHIFVDDVPATRPPL